MLSTQTCLRRRFQAPAGGNSAAARQLCLKKDKTCGPECKHPSPRVDEDIRNVLPPPAKSVRKALTERIKAEGATIPLRLWAGEGAILDGCLRYEIYQALGISDFPTVALEFASKEEAKLWRYQTNVTACRHLNAYCRVRAALLFEEYFHKLGRKNHKRGGSGNHIRDGEKIDTLKSVAEIAHVSRDTASRVKRILNSAMKVMDPERAKEMLANLESGEKTINSAHEDIIRDRRVIARAKKARRRCRSEGSRDASEGNADAGQVYENVILNCDVLDGLRQLPDGYISLCFSSPPYYGVNDDYGGTGTLFTEYCDYLEWLKNILAECQRVLRVGGRAVINIDSTLNRQKKRDQGSYRRNIVADVGRTAEEVGFLYREDIVWNKQKIAGCMTSDGNPPRRPCIRRNHEYLIVFSKGSHSLENVTGMPHDLLQKERKAWTLSVWDIRPETRGKGDHPHACPEE